MPANLENSAVATGLEKFSFHSNPKECLDYHTAALISCGSKVMLKIFQARLQQYMNRELSDVQAGFRKGRGIRDEIANIPWIIKKNKSSRKISILALLTTPKPLAVWTQQPMGNSSREFTRPPYLPPEKSVYRSRSNS